MTVEPIGMGSVLLEPLPHLLVANEMVFLSFPSPAYVPRAPFLTPTPHYVTLDSFLVQFWPQEERIPFGWTCLLLCWSSGCSEASCIVSEDANLSSPFLGSRLLLLPCSPGMQ